jgi:hypothetical protein
VIIAGVFGLAVGAALAIGVASAALLAPGASSTG